MFDFIRNLAKSAEEKQRERLHAYVDGELSATEQRAFEQQLAADPVLQAEVDSLRQVKAGMRSLPRVSAPRNFTLDPAVYGRPEPDRLSSFLPALRVATALTALLFVSVLVLDLLNFSRQAGAPEAVTFLSERDLAAFEPAADEAPEAPVEVTQVVTEMEEVGPAAPAEAIIAESEVPVEEEAMEEAGADMAMAEEAIGEERAPTVTPTPIPIPTGPTVAEAPLAPGDGEGAASEPYPLVEGTEVAEGAYPPEIAGETAEEPAAILRPTPTRLRAPLSDDETAFSLDGAESTPAFAEPEPVAGEDGEPLSGLRLAQYVLGTVLLIFLALLLLAARRR